LFALVKRAREDRRRQTLTELVRREARIVPLASGAAGPRIDGSLDDPAWRGIRPLEGFVPCRKAAGAVPAATEVRATYDDKALYVFFRCGEPATDKLAAVGEQRDDDIWKGDVVEFFISLGESPSVYRHFMLNPKGVQWDAATGPAGEDVRWNGEWRGGARIGEREWTAEMAIPWECIGGAPKPGTARYANFCRCRRAGNELSTWSQVAERFQEPDAFGKMIFSVGG
jgi:hypothetical protein